MQGVQVPSLVGELRCHMPYGTAKKIFFLIKKMLRFITPIKQILFPFYFLLPCCPSLPPPANPTSKNCLNHFRDNSTHTGLVWNFLVNLCLSVCENWCSLDQMELFIIGGCIPEVFHTVSTLLQPGRTLQISFMFNFRMESMHKSREPRVSCPNP